MVCGYCEGEGFLRSRSGKEFPCPFCAPARDHKHLLRIEVRSEDKMAFYQEVFVNVKGWYLHELKFPIPLQALKVSIEK